MTTPVYGGGPIEAMPTPLSLALDYLSRGISPVPVIYREKKPTLKGWPSIRITSETAGDYFNGRNQNIGGLWGDASGGLADADLDAVEVRRIVDRFVEPTRCRYGRASSRDSHLIFRLVPGIAKPMSWDDPTIADKDDERASLIELRWNRQHSLLPGSTHPSGESYTWDADGVPAEVHGDVLVDQLNHAAAAALLGRYWRHGVRQKQACALAGSLLRGGWTVEKASGFVEAVAIAGEDDEIEKRVQAVRDTAEDLRTDQPATGWPTLAKFYDPAIVNRVRDWLGFVDPVGGASFVLPKQVDTVESEQPAGLPEVEDSADTVPEWRQLVNVHPLRVSALPYHLHRLITHISPYTNMFPDDWAIMMSLPFWSSLFPTISIENLKLAIWSLGVSHQGVGKNIGTDEQARVTREVAGVDLQFFTAGTPEGLWDALNGDGKRVLAYMDEFGGFLKLMRREHMQGARETFSSLYDGRPVAYLRSRGSSVVANDPNFTMVATTQVASIRQFVEPRDLTDGFISRFMICCPDPYAVAPLSYPGGASSRIEIVKELRQHLDQFKGIRRMVWLESGDSDPDVLRDYAEHLNMNTGEVINLDDAATAEVIPAGRLVARVKKIAGLLELAEPEPNFRLDKYNNRVVEIRPEHVETAIAIVQCGHGYALRMREWVGQSEDYELAAKVMRVIKENPGGVTQRQLCRVLSTNAAHMKIALELNQSAGLVACVQIGKRILWKQP